MGFALSRPSQRSDGHPQGGFTLIEVLIAASLFALIGVAGFALVQGILGAQRRTDMRLERLADLQRTMHIVTADFEQAEPGTLSFDGTSVSFRRATHDDAGAESTVSFGLSEGVFFRTLSGTSIGPRRQALIGDVTKVAWRFYQSRVGWQPGPSGRNANGAADDPWAVEVQVTLKEADGREQDIRRVVALPRRISP